MRRSYFILLAVLGAIMVYGYQTASNRYVSNATVMFYLGSVVAFFTLLGVLLLMTNAARLSEIWFVRMFRLWREAKEIELKKRAGKP